MEVPQQVREIRPGLLGPADTENGVELLWMAEYVTRAHVEFAREPWIQRALDVVTKRIARRYVTRAIRMQERAERNHNRRRRRNRRGGRR